MRRVFGVLAIASLTLMVFFQTVLATNGDNLIGIGPVERHNGFDGGFNPSGAPNTIANVQGAIFPSYYYETFRIVGFPAIVEKHLTLGAGYRTTDRFSMNLGYMHAFEKTTSESGTDPMGQPVTLQSKLSEDGLDFGLTWFF